MTLLLLFKPSLELILSLYYYFEVCLNVTLFILRLNLKIFS